MENPNKVKPEGFGVMNYKELALMAAIVNEENGGDIEETLKTCQFFDRALMLMKGNSICRKRPKLRLKDLKTSRTWIGHDINMLMVNQWPETANQMNPYEMKIADRAKNQE